MFQSFSTAFAQNAFTSVSHASIIFLVFFNIGIYLFFTIITYMYSRPIWIKNGFSMNQMNLLQIFIKFVILYFVHFIIIEKILLLLCYVDLLKLQLWVFL